MAAHAFSKAVEFDSNNLQAKHMLASITADATMKRADNSYVKDLFDQYAQNFEHSLVEELGYDGYARLRRGFDRAFGGEANVPKFHVVVDAGCGTGLVGEQVRIFFNFVVWNTILAHCFHNMYTCANCFHFLHSNTDFIHYSFRCHTKFCVSSFAT